jgi:hypothetical protein
MTHAQFDTVGKIAKAESTHPYETLIDFILTDFLPNKNNQAVPMTEADSLINTAIGMPVKIHLAQKGHAGSYPIGPIKSAWLGKDGDRDVIYAQASIWNREFPDVDKFVKTAYAEETPVGTSWEISYEDSEHIDNVEWLHKTVFAATVIVERPAYGRQRTRMLSVAEETTMEEERLKLLELQEMWTRIGDHIRTAYATTFEIEAAEVATPENVEQFIEQFNALTAKITERAKNAGLAVAEETKTELTAKETALAEKESAIADLTTQLETEKTERLFAERSFALASVFSVDELKERRDQLLAFTPDAFSLYARDISNRSKVATASEKFNIPNLIGNRSTRVDDIVNALSTKESK